MLAACGSTPPPPGSRAAEADTCRAKAVDAVDRQNAKTGLAWMAGPFTRWSRIDSQLDACLGSQGFARTRACTPEELRLGNRAPNLTVTAAGIRCTDPGRT